MPSKAPPSVVIVEAVKSPPHTAINLPRERRKYKKTKKVEPEEDKKKSPYLYVILVILILIILPNEAIVVAVFMLVWVTFKTGVTKIRSNETRPSQGNNNAPKLIIKSKKTCYVGDCGQPIFYQNKYYCLMHRNL